MSSPNTFCQDHSNVQPVAKGVMAGDTSSSASAHDSALGVHSDSISVGERAFATDKPPLFDHTTEAALPNNQLDQSTGVESGLQVLQVSKNVRQIGEVDSNNLQSPCKYRKTANLTDVIGQAYSQIDTMSAKINLAQTVADCAKALFQRAQNLKPSNMKGPRNRDAIVAACLFISCRQNGVPRSFKEVSVLSSVPQKELRRSFRLILKELDISADAVPPDDYTTRFAADLGLSPDEQNMASHISRRATELGITTGRNPLMFAAASIYMTLQTSRGTNRMSCERICLLVKIPESSVKSTCKLLFANAAQLFAPNPVPAAFAPVPDFRFCPKILDKMPASSREK